MTRLESYSVNAGAIKHADEVCTLHKEHTVDILAFASGVPQSITMLPKSLAEELAKDILKK